MMTTTRTMPAGKTEFVKTVLANDPFANTKAVNDAWNAAGRSGQISATLVNKLRSSLGYAGNLRASSKTKVTSPASAIEKPPYTGKKRGRKPKQAMTAGVPTQSYFNGIQSSETKAAQSSRTAINADHKLLEDLEADFDRLLFKVMGMGGMPSIEESLRQTRRLLYGGFSGNRS